MKLNHVYLKLTLNDALVLQKATEILLKARKATTLHTRAKRVQGELGWRIRLISKKPRKTSARPSPRK